MTERRALRCAVYTRKSTEEGLEQDFNSLQAQREACESFIRSQRSEGWILVPTAYDDGGISGGTMERPALKRLFAHIEEKRVDVVVVYKVDRLTRSLSDFSKMVDLFDRHSVSFVAVTQQFNTTTSMGRLTLNVLLSFAQFEREVTAERIRDKIADHMCGIVKRCVDKLLEAGRPAIIGRDEFYAAYTSYVRKIDRDTVLLSRANVPTEEESRGQLPKVFVQQLDIIGLSYEEMLEAVSDYLMAAADRTDWAARGEVDASSFDDLDSSLKRSWRNKQRACSVSHADKPEQQQGKVLYSDCMQFNAPLQSMEPPSHFIPGCFHRLADDLSIGWHPDYEKRLKAKKAA